MLPVFSSSDSDSTLHQESPELEKGELRAQAGPSKPVMLEVKTKKGRQCQSSSQCLTMKGKLGKRPSVETKQQVTSS
jgi:hypothetical protein